VRAGAPESIMSLSMLGSETGSVGAEEVAAAAAAGVAEEEEELKRMAVKEGVNLVLVRGITAGLN
jgi:hypothetical protein